MAEKRAELYLAICMLVIVLSGAAMFGGMFYSLHALRAQNAQIVVGARDSESSIKGTRWQPLGKLPENPSSKDQPQA